MNIRPQKATTATVYSQKLAGYLMQRGFVLVKMAPDKKDTRRNIFFFNDTSLLQHAINDYLQSD